MVSVEVIADSVSISGHRLTTMQVTMHRFVLAEFNTHRVFSRNSASSRAIPIEKNILKVRENPAMPLQFGSKQPGMQSGPPLTGAALAAAEAKWYKAAMYAADRAEELNGMGVHKEVVNRILEPFMWHTVIVSSTEWENFFKQRCSPLAQPEIRKAAEYMRNALFNSAPQFIEDDGLSYHLPYVFDEEKDMLHINDQIKVSVARCARVSYLTHGGVRDVHEDIAFYERLIKADPPHYSPLEHVARPSEFSKTDYTANFTGWEQVRTLVEKVDFVY